VFARVASVALALSLSACSLINAYDDVIEGGSGGSTSSSTTSTTSSAGGGGGGSTTTSSAGGEGGAGGSGGEGGGAGGQGGGGGDGGAGGGGGDVGPDPLGCSFVSGDKLNLSSYTPSGAPAGLFPFVTSNNTTRMVVVRGTTAQLVQVNAAGQTALGTAIGHYGIVDVQRIESATGAGVGALAVHAMTAIEEYHLRLHVWEDGKLATEPPTTYDFGYISEDPIIEGVFTHVGPAPDAIDTLLQYSPSLGAPIQTAYHRRHPNPAMRSETIVQTNASQVADAPMALLASQSVANVAAFVGRPSAAGTGATRLHHFPPGDFPGTAWSTGGNGTAVRMAKPDGSLLAMFGTVYGTSGVELRLGHLLPTDVPSQNLVTTKLRAVGSFPHAQPSPASPRASLAPQTLYYAGLMGTLDKLSLRVFQIGNTAATTGLRFHSDDFVQLDPTSQSFGPAVAASNAPVGSDGGTGFLFFTERNATATTERLYRLRFTCSP
jgi:hypothetical protein